MPTNEVNAWLKQVKETIEKATAKEVEITGGPYRGYDVEVDLSGETPKLDFYSPVRRFADREADAIDYAICCIKEDKILSDEEHLNMLTDRIYHGIYRQSFFPGEPEHVPVEPEHVKAWCKECQFPYTEGGCKTRGDIQKCWDVSEAIAGKWHLQHECPFVHKGEKCRCNDYRTIKAAFKAAGIEYKEV